MSPWCLRAVSLLFMRTFYWILPRHAPFGNAVGLKPQNWQSIQSLEYKQQKL